MAIAGGCLCRAVRFEIDADAPLGARYCWCRVCQYLGAGTGAVSALFRKESVTVSGPLTDHVIRADSGSIMHRRFCSQCGTPVFSEAEQRPQAIFVRAGALDDPDLRGAHGDHLDQVRAEMGLLRSGSAANRRTAAPAAYGITVRAHGDEDMLFMVIERFRDDDMVPVYRRLRDRGRSLPEGLEYVDSWVEPNFSRCFQLMRCDDLRLIQTWILEWRGCGVTFEIIPVVASSETRAVVEPHL